MNRGVNAGTKQAPAPSPIPPGIVWEYGGVALPDPTRFGVWLWADGSLVSRSQYPDLFLTMGFAHSPTPGTDPGGNQFYLPNRKGKVGVGLDVTITDFNALGKTGGSSTTTAPHTHDLAHGHGITNQVPSDNTTNTVNGAYGAGVSDRDHTHAINHYHTAYIGNVKAWSGFSHQHVNSGGYAAEGAEQGSAGAGTIPVNVDGTAYGAPGGTNVSSGQSQGHYHGLESHDHLMKNHTHANTVTSLGTTASGASSAAATTGNLQPYTTMNYIVKV